MARRSLLSRIGFRNEPADLDAHGASLQASAQIIDLNDSSESARLGDKAVAQKWHHDAWTYRRNIGEVRYVQDWLGVAVGRMRLFPAVLVDGLDEPVPLAIAIAPPEGSDVAPVALPASLVQDATDALKALGNVSLLLQRATVSLEVTGEFFLVGYIGTEGKEIWEARNRDELQRTDFGWLLRDTPGSSNRQGGRPSYTHEGGKLLDPADSYVCRIWRSDAQWTGLSTSPMASVLGECETLLLLVRKVRGQARSRLSADLLLVPSEADFKPTIDPATGKAIPAKGIQQVLNEHVMTPIGDETHPASVVPTSLKAPGAVLKEFRLLEMGRKADPHDAAQRAEFLLRILQGLDAAPETATGFKDVKYANAVAIDQNTFRYNVEPKVLTLVHALTIAYLRVRLGGLGYPATLLDQLVCWYDPSNLVSDPNQGENALKVYERGELSGAALRRYMSFPESDAPSEEERARYYALKTLGRVILDANGEPTSAPMVQADNSGSSGTSEPAQASAQARIRMAHANVEAMLGRQPLQLLAAATPEPAPSSLGDQLLHIDVSLFERTQALMDAAMRRALERAGARARTAARAHGTKVEPTVANDQLTQSLGRDGLAELGLSTEELLTGDPFADAVARFEVWAEAAFEQGLRAYCRALGLTYYPPAVTAAGGALTASGEGEQLHLAGLDQVSLREQAALDRRAASEQLKARLTALASQRLYEAAQTEQGESDPTATVPPGVIRGAVARAGGADSHPRSGGVTDDGQPNNPLDPLPGGVAGGWLLREAARDAGLAPYAYAWIHGASPNPFDPHLELDGGVFVQQDDRRLSKSPAEFPKGSTSWFPGDHAGCTCHTRYLFADPFASMTPTEAKRARASQQARDERGRFAQSVHTHKGSS